MESFFSLLQKAVVAGGIVRQPLQRAGLVTSALADSEMLDSAQQLFIDGALDAVVSEPVEEIEEAASANEPVAVIRLPDDELGPPSIRPGDPEVGLSPEPGDEGSD